MPRSAANDSRSSHYPRINPDLGWVRPPTPRGSSLPNRSCDKASPHAVNISARPADQRFTFGARLRANATHPRRNFTVSNFHTQLTFGGDNCGGKGGLHVHVRDGRPEGSPAFSDRAIQRPRGIREVGRVDHLRPRSIGARSQVKRSGAVDHHPRAKRTEDQTPCPAACAPRSCLRGLLLREIGSSGLVRRCIRYATLRSIGFSERPLERDDLSSNRHPALFSCLRMIFSENRYPLFRIML